ncbi:MAG TPA: sigma-70 family RNA polymerase sigma factor [Kofleriaceae bacterium]
MTSDAELLEASKRGERAAFGALVERYQNVVSAVSYSRTRDQALSEDVAQETFLAAWRQLDQLREAGRLKSWLCGIARNLARKARRRTSRETTTEVVEGVSLDNPFDDVCEAQAERVVGEALARVPENYRDVLVLYYREHRSIKDVARALDLSEAAALQRLARGRQYLADGVTGLVERSLRGHRVKKNLAACVVAALPAVVPSRVEAATSSHGGSMLKLALAAAALTAAGTTIYVASSTSSSDAPPAPAAAVVERAAVRAPVPAPQLAPQARGPAPSLEHPHQLPPGGVRASDPDAHSSVSAADFDRLRAKGPAKGDASAPITVVMFTDLQCPYCEKMHGTLDQLFEEYQGKIRLVIKQMPVHKSAELAAEASLAADAQGKFWELQDKMLAASEDLSRDKLVAMAREAGLDEQRLASALDSHTYAAAVAEDTARAKELEINGTPGFVVNGRRVVGARAIDDWRALFDELLATKTAKN